MSPAVKLNVSTAATGIIIGIDPGVTGALAWFINGELSSVMDMPAVATRVPRKGSHLRDLIGGTKDQMHRVVDIPALVSILTDWKMGQSVRIVREKVWVRPGQGIVSSGKLLENSGMLDGVAASLYIPVYAVAPATWKSKMNCPAAKPAACQRAIEEFPAYARYFKRVSIDHNRAEAALIGLYGVRYPQ